MKKKETNMNTKKKRTHSKKMDKMRGGTAKGDDEACFSLFFLGFLSSRVLVGEQQSTKFPRIIGFRH